MSDPHLRRRTHDDLIRRVVRFGATSVQYRRWTVRVHPDTTETADGRQPIAEARPHDPSVLPEERRGKWLASRDAYDPARGRDKQLEYGLRQLLGTIDHYADHPDALKG